jgi:hypothetical protein
MPNKTRARIPVGASLLAGALVLGASCAADAACLAQPDRQAAPGGHWYYRLDRETQQRCWYLKQSQATAPQASEPAAQAADGPPQLLSWLSSAISAITRPAAPGQDATGRDADPDASPDGSRRRRASMARRSEPPKARSKSAPRQAAQSAAAAPVTASPLDDPATSELYQDFLHWRARQLLAPDSPPGE